jgi:dihydroxynaphthoic acid synthetase
MGKTSRNKSANARTNGRGYRDILYEVKDEVAWVTINRPRVLNAFREQSLDEMIDALRSTREDPSIACAVVTGAGDKAFSAGGDFYAMTRLTWTNAAMWNDRMQGLAMTIRGLPIPVIAMINGWCMGGGHELALWCDLAIASENAVLGQTGAKVGACPTVGATQYLPRLIGERLAREMIFCARRFTAQEAVTIGLINKCVPQKDLLKETLAWCETIKGHSPQTLRMTKKSLNFESDLLYASWQHGMELLAHVWGSPESLEGMNAFLEGRKPDFRKFRMRSKQELADYLDGCAKDLNAPPTMRVRSSPSPLVGEGRRAGSRGAAAHALPTASPAPHPDPLPASGEREKLRRTGAARAKSGGRNAKSAP